MRKWYRFENLADDTSTVELLIFDHIGASFFDDSAVTAKQFMGDLKALPKAVKNIVVRVNSLGGDVFEAVAITNALRDQRTKGRSVTTVVDGIAASAASLVIMAGETIQIAENGLVMVHDPFAFTVGNAGQMRKTADALDKVRDSSIVPTYQLHSSLDADEIRDLMAAETFMDADEAIALGFATEKIEGLKAAASLDPRAVATLTIPAAYRDRIAALVTPPAATSAAADPREVLRLCREGECLDLAESLVTESLPVAAVQAAIASERDRRTAVEARTTEIRALCRSAHLETLADGYIRGTLSAGDVRAHLTTITAAIDHTEIDGALPPDQGTRHKPVIDITAVYAERNMLTTTKE